jgi:hypothetical protein
VSSGGATETVIRIHTVRDLGTEDVELGTKGRSVGELEKEG